MLRVEADPQESGVVREIARRVLDGESSSSVARDLNARGVARPEGAIWRPSVILKILTNPSYAGRRVHVRQESGEREVYEATWPAIVSPEDYARLGAMFAARSREGHTTNPKYLLTGIVVCGKCADAVMYVQYRAPDPSATTSARARTGQKGVYQCVTCRRTRNQAALERFVVDTMNTWLRDPVFRAAEAADVRAEAAVSADRSALEVARTELTQAEADLSVGVISARAFTITERRLTPVIDRLERRIASVEGPSDAMTAYLDQGAPPLSDMTMSEQRELLKSLIRVRCLATPRGRGFHPECVEILPLRVWRQQQALHTGASVRRRVNPPVRAHRRRPESCHGSQGACRAFNTPYCSRFRIRCGFRRAPLARAGVSPSARPAHPPGGAAPATPPGQTASDAGRSRRAGIRGGAWGGVSTSSYPSPGNQESVNVLDGGGSQGPCRAGRGRLPLHGVHHRPSSGVLRASRAAAWLIVMSLATSAARRACPGVYP